MVGVAVVGCSAVLCFATWCCVLLGLCCGVLGLDCCALLSLCPELGLSFLFFWITVVHGIAFLCCVVLGQCVLLY